MPVSLSYQLSLLSILASMLTNASFRRGFTKYAREDYKQWKQEGRLTHDGVNAKLIHNHGRLNQKVAEGINVFETPAMDKKIPLHGGV